MKETADIRVWDDFREGKEYALALIYHKHIHKLYQYGRKFSADEELVKDSIQELFFDLIRRRENLGQTDNISFYLFASLRRKLKKQAQRNVFTTESSTEKDFVGEIVYSVEHEMIEREELSERELSIQRALKSLSAKQREVLYYKFTCDFSYEEICELMSLKYDSARKLVSRAIAALREVVCYSTESIVLFLRAYFVDRELCLH